MWWIDHQYVLTASNVEKLQPLLALLYTTSDEGISVHNKDGLVALVKGNMSATNPAQSCSVNLRFKEVPWSGTMALLPVLSKDLLNSMATSGAAIVSFDTWLSSTKATIANVVDTCDSGNEPMLPILDVPGLTLDKFLPTFSKLALEIGVTRAYHDKTHGSIFFGIPSKKYPGDLHPVMMTYKSVAGPHIAFRNCGFPSFDCDDGFVETSAFEGPRTRDLTQWNNDWEDWKQNWDVRTPILKWSM